MFYRQLLFEFGPLLFPFRQSLLIGLPHPFHHYSMRVAGPNVSSSGLRMNNANFSIILDHHAKAKSAGDAAIGILGIKPRAVRLPTPNQQAFLQEHLLILTNVPEGTLSTSQKVFLQEHFCLTSFVQTRWGRTFLQERFAKSLDKSRDTTPAKDSLLARNVPSGTLGWFLGPEM
jgi:hypothetical protein